MTITGTIQNIIFRNADNGWTVMEVLTGDGDELSVVGILPLCSAGEQVELAGEYAEHPKYGIQFKAASARTLAPASLGAIEAYLASGLIKGIGPSTARTIVEHFGLETLQILDEEPGRLTEVSGIGPKKAAMITLSYQENRSMRDILIALEPYGITPNQACRLYKIYGVGCLARIEENPYQIIEDVDGVGFLTADKIAQNVSGFGTDSPARLRAGLLYALKLAYGEYGHTFLPRESLLSYAEKLLNVGRESLDEELDRLIENHSVFYVCVEETDGIFLPRMHNMEVAIAQKLLKLSMPVADNPFSDFAVTAPKNGITLAPQQAEAVRLALKNGALVITGGPGTGKTTIIRCITEILAQNDMDFALAAPTGRAAKRMTEATGREAKTIHRLLEYMPGEGFMRNADNPLFFDMIIVDEMSMVDVPLFLSLLSAIPEGTRLIMVGDSDQLPSVGPGNVLRDLTDSGVIPVVRLTEIFRQAKMSRIVTNAHRINKGEPPILENNVEEDFMFFEDPLQERVLEKVVRICQNPSFLPTREPFMDLQVLVPMKKGPLGVHNLNKRLQEALNPPSPRKEEHLYGEKIFREGDKVMQVVNDYKIEWTKRVPGAGDLEGSGVFNGDLGTVWRIDDTTRTMSVIFDDDRLATYEFTQCDELDLAYAISIHKSQGSEFPIVILPLVSGPPMLLTRNLLYTAVTRARQRVVMLGRRDAVCQMVNNNRDTRRYTALKPFLREWADLLGRDPT